MRLVTVAALAMVLGAVTACGREQTPQAGPRQDLVEFADAFDHAQLAKDGTALERMVADDLVFIDGSGKRSGKKEFIAGWTAPGDTFDPIKLIDRTVRPVGNEGGAVSAETVLSGISGGKRFSSRFRYSDTFRWDHDRWQAVHIQVTRIPE
jgi:ketosteroid isomerase-like protein